MTDETGRKKLGLKPKAEGEKGQRRKPVRWSPLQRDRSKQEEKPAPEAKAKAAAKGGAETRRRPGSLIPSPSPEGGRERLPPSPSGTSPKGAGRHKMAVPNEARDGPQAHRGAGGEGIRADKSAPRRRAPPKAPATLKFFAPCPRGLEAELAKELTELGADAVEPGSGGTHFSGGIALAWKVNLWSRLAIRVLQQVADGDYLDEDDLYRATLKLPWSDWFGVDRTIAVRTVAHNAPLKSLNFVTLKIKDAVCDRFRQDLEARPSVEARTPDVPILLYLDRSHFTLYLDLSGDPLNRRGYRIEPAPAPLNENLAAGLLKLSGWTSDQPLLDPMMGGGTILLEAAMIALNRAPGMKRHFAFEHLISFDKVEWTRIRKDAQAAELEPRQLPIYGCDIDPRMVRASGLNLKAAGLLDCVTLREGDVLEIPSPGEHGVIVSNPPYGVRLDSDAAFYKDLGDALKQHFSGWTAWLISSDETFPKSIGLAASRRIPLYNGPLECRLFEYRMVEGRMARRGD